MKNLVEESVKTYGQPFSFEDLLQNVYSLDYSGTKDDWEYGYRNWLADLDGEEYIELGEQLYKLLTR